MEPHKGIVETQKSSSQLLHWWSTYKYPINGKSIYCAIFQNRNFCVHKDTLKNINKIS